MARKVRFVTYPHALSNEPSQLEEFEIEDLFAWLGEHELTDCAPCKGKDCPAKDGLAWSPGFVPAGKKRGNKFVESVDVGVFDIDNITWDEFEGLLGRLENLNLLIHSSHSHAPPNQVKIRVVFELSRRVTPTEWTLLWHVIIRTYDLPMFDDSKRGVDKACKDPSRIYFAPRAPRGAPTIQLRGEGPPLDVDALLLGAHLAKPLDDEERAPVLDHGVVDMGSLRKHLVSYTGGEGTREEKLERLELIRRVLAEEPLADKPPNGTGRDIAVLRAATILGWLMPLGTPPEAALEILRPAVAKMPQYADDQPGENVDGWMTKAAVNYDKVEERKLAEADFHSRVLALARRKATGPAPGPIQPGSTLLAPAGAPPPPSQPPQTEAETEGWRLERKISVDKKGTAVPAAVAMNVALILEKHRQWKGMLRYNDVTKDIDCFGGPIPKEEQVSEMLATAVENWIQAHEDIVVNSSIVRSQMLFVAQKNRYDPIRDYLLSHTWDGVQRLDTWLEVYCGARIIEDDTDISAYVRGISCRWLIAGAARALSPGCKADTVLILEGEQGAKKSTALDVLGGEFFTDTPLVLSDPNARMITGSSWIVELAELSSMRQAETEQQKAFFSARIDKFRPAYGYRPQTFRRRCIFAGSTNATTYLRDVTGNRRFWPVYCEKFDIDALRRDRDQLWAEAVVRYNAHVANPKTNRWWFEEDEWRQFEAITNRRLHGEDDASAVLEWWTRQEPEKRPEHVSGRDVAIEALKIPEHLIEDRSAIVGRAMKRLGFVHCRRRVDGQVAWRYFPSEQLRAMPKRELSRRRHLALVAGATTPVEGSVT